MRAIALVILLTACQGSDDDYRVIPGGDDTTITPGPDAPPVEPDAPDGGRAIAGRVCLLRDARAQTACASTGAGGLRVKLGTAETITEDDGTFSIAAPSGTNLLWRVTGTDLVTSVMPLTATATIPALTVTDYTELLVANSVLLNADEGSAFVRVVQADAPLAGVRVTSEPPYFVLYDGTSKTTWGGAATSTAGVAWIPAAVVGSTTLTVLPPAGGALGLDVPVEASAITFVTVDVP